jgi:hypothetical protein
VVSGFRSVAAVVAHLLIGFGFLGGSSLFGARTKIRINGMRQAITRDMRRGMINMDIRRSPRRTLRMLNTETTPVMGTILSRYASFSSSFLAFCVFDGPVYGLVDFSVSLQCLESQCGVKERV